jgi:tetratricopeptide (TPR) repeat protein
MVAGDIVHHREVQVPVLGLGDVIVGHLVGRAPLARGNRGDALLLAGLIVRRVAHGEELVPALDDELPELREFCHFGFRRLVGKNLPPDFGIAQPGALLGDAQIFKLSVARPHRERVERGADAHPNYAPAYAARGAILRLKGDLDRSLADLDKAVSLNPRSATFLYLRGETLRESGALDKAIADYDDALRLIPGLAAVYTTRGLAYEGKGDLAKARADFDKALKLPSVSDAETTKPAQEIAKSHLAALEAKEKAALEAKAMKAAEFSLANNGSSQRALATQDGASLW